MLHREYRFIFDITEAQCAGIQRVFIGCRRAGNHRAIQLGVLPHPDINTARTGKNTRLRLHRIILAG
ncbi:Uncharacterised protein [Yersinia pseudotuberculosis]|nr:Uncharacterised protein [Yersinia pseudotuberculosis]